MQNNKDKKKLSTFAVVGILYGGALLFGIILVLCPEASK